MEDAQRDAAIKRSQDGAGAPYGPASWAAGTVHRLYSPDELKEFLRAFDDRLVVMCCKAKGCRPCKAFERKYLRCADEYRDVVFLEMYGDESKETRKLMLALQVKSTPTFMLFKERASVHQHSGINEAKLRNAINMQLGLDATLVERDDPSEHL